MTPYSEIDNMFLSDISDDTFFNFEIEDREEILNNLRIKAITRFKACKKNLYDKDDAEKQFNETLTDEEKLILATIMRKHWLNDKIYNLDLIKQRMSTKDWKLTSQQEHLKTLTSLNNELDKEISKMVVDYCTYTYSPQKEN